jgi:hypothetical protein
MENPVALINPQSEIRTPQFDSTAGPLYRVATVAISEGLAPR